MLNIRKDKYSLTMKNMKLGTKEYTFNHERHESNNRNEAGRKYKSANYSGDSRNNSLTQVFAFFVNFRAFRGRNGCSLCSLW